MRVLRLVGLYLVVVAAALPSVTLGKLAFGWDCLREYWPDLIFGARALAEGELPLWNPYALGGYAFHGDPQAGLYAPLNWLLYALAWLTGSQGAWLMQVKVMTYLVLGAVGMHLWIYRRERSHLAGFVAAAVLVFGSPYLVHKNGALLWPALVMPWVLLALDGFLDAPRAGRGAILALAFWLLGTAGHPQSFFFGLLVALAYWLFRTAQDPAGLRDQLRGLAVCGGLAAALLLPLYLPAATAVASSPRAARGAAYALDSPLSPRDLNELVVPALNADWAHDIYLGAATLLLASVAVLGAWRRRERADRLFWLALALGAVAFAFGARTPILPFLVDHVPGFGMFRIAWRYKLILGFAAAVLAGAGVATLLRQAVGPRLRLSLAAGATAWFIAALALGGARVFLVPAALAVALVVGAALHATQARRYLVGAVLALALDLYAAGRDKLDLLQPIPDLIADAAVLAHMPGIDRDVRYWNDGLLPHHLPYLYDVRELSGFSNPVVVARQELLAAAVGKTPAILRHFNVRWFVSRRSAGRGLRRVERELLEVEGQVPLLRVYPRAELVPATFTLERMAQPGPLTAALVDVDDGPPPLPEGDGAPVDGRVVSYARNRIEVEIDTAAPGIAVLAENHYPHWQATVDGAPTPIFRANYLNRAVVVPAGHHRLVFTYAPPAQRALLAMFVLGLLTAVGLAWRTRLSAPPTQP